MFGAAQSYLSMTGKQNIFQIVFLFSVVVNFCLNKFLVPVYGMTGSAVAFAVSMFLWNFIAAGIIYKKDKINIFII